MSNKIRTDKNKLPFKIVETPELNHYYHLTWAYSGAKFCLTEIHTDKIHGTVWTGKTNNKYFKIKLADLRHIR